MSENNGVYYVDDTPLKQSDIDKVNRLVDQGQYSTAGKIISDFLKTKKYGKPTRGALSLWAENMGNTAGKANDTADDAKAIAQDTQNRFDVQINGQDKDDEAKDARVSPADGKTYNALKDRLDAMDKKPQAAVDNIKLGGANLLYKTNFILSENGMSNNDMYCTIGNVKGKTVTASLLCDYQNVSRVSNEQRILFRIDGTDADGNVTHYDLTITPEVGETHWGRVAKTFIISGDTIKFDISVAIQGVEAQYMRVGYPMLEESNKPSKWNPAPEDEQRHQVLRHGTLFFAHRGAQLLSPENSLPAIRKAGNHNGVEIDIHETSDNRWVVMHDGTVDRMTDGTGAISSMTFADLRKLKFDAGAFITDLKDEDNFVPTLEEVLIECKNQKLMPVIEIKVDPTDQYTSENYDDLANIIKRFRLEDECMFISFNYPALQQIKHRLNNVEVGFLVTDVTDDIITKARNLGTNASLDLSINYNGWSNEVVDKVHRANLAIGVWTTTDDSQRHKLIGYGVDYITGNYISGKEKFAELPLQSGFTRIGSSDVPHVQEIKPGVILLEFNITGGTRKESNTVIANLPNWAIPTYEKWSNCVSRTNDGIQLATFNILKDGTLRVGIGWSASLRWVSGSVVYHI